MNFNKLACLVLLLVQLGPQATAAPVDAAAIKTFESGATLTAADLNATIGALVTAANDNAARIVELEAAAAASTTLDIANRQYCVVSLSTGFHIFNGASDSNERQDDVGNSIGVFKGGITFNSGGTAVLNVYSDVLKEAFPNRSVIDNSDPAGQETGTWTLDGNIVQATFGDDSVSFALSKSGDVLMGAILEGDASSDNSGIWYDAELILLVEVSDSSTCSQI